MFFIRIESELFYRIYFYAYFTFLIRVLPVSIVDSGKPTEAFVLLFDDMLLITRRKKGLHKKVKPYLDLTHLKAFTLLRIKFY